MTYYVSFCRFVGTDSSLPDFIDFTFSSNFRKGSEDNIRIAYGELYHYLVGKGFLSLSPTSVRNCYGILDLFKEV